MPAERIFEFEQTFSRSSVSQYLREIADKLDSGQIELQAGGKSTTVSVSEQVEFEVKVERTTRADGSVDMELEFELEWREGEDGQDGTLTIQ